MRKGDNETRAPFKNYDIKILRLIIHNQRINAHT